MAHFRKLPHRCQKIAHMSLTQGELILSQMSLSWQRGSVGGKCDWQHSMAHQRKPPHKRKNLAEIFYRSRAITNFVPNFVAMATGVGREKMSLAAFDGASPKPPPYRCKNLEKCSYASRVIANFVPNFVTMARGVGRGKMRKWTGWTTKEEMLA